MNAHGWFIHGLFLVNSQGWLSRHECTRLIHSWIIPRKFPGMIVKAWMHTADPFMDYSTYIPCDDCQGMNAQGWYIHGLFHVYSQGWSSKHECTRVTHSWFIPCLFPGMYIRHANCMGFNMFISITYLVGKETCSKTSFLCHEFHPW